jgi:nucleoside-diphosphate-sugar epimerase
MGDEDAEPVVVRKVLMFGSTSFIGAALMETMQASGYELEAATADSNVLAADVVVCNVYGKDPVR